MGFISYSLKEYLCKIEYWENHDLSSEELYIVKQYLKMLDDLVDEGYYELSNRIESEFNGVTRIKNILLSYNELPFMIDKLNKNKIAYKENRIELKVYLDSLIVSKAKNYSNNPLIDDILSFSKWLAQDSNCAYVFLLRDTMLPYIYFKKNYNYEVYPWLIGRSFLDHISNVKGLDDIIRAAIFYSLENYNKDYKSFINCCRKKLLNDLNDFSYVLDILRGLLKSIKSERIIVVESGIYATFPILFSILDDRVDFKMFTTVPYLSEIYKDRIYTKEYEKNRLFETLYSQDKLFKFDSFIDNDFYIVEANDINVIEKSILEISTILRGDL